MNGTLWILPASISSGLLIMKSISDDYVIQFISNKNVNIVNSIIPLSFLLLYKLICFSSIVLNFQLISYAFIHNMSIMAIEKSKSLINHEPNAMIIQSLNILPTSIYCYYTSAEFDMRMTIPIIITNGVVYVMWYYDNQYTQISSEEDNLAESLLDNVKRRNYIFLAVLSCGLFTWKDVMLKNIINNNHNFVDIFLAFYFMNFILTPLYCRVDNQPLVITYVDNYERVRNNLKATIFYVFSLFADYLSFYSLLSAFYFTNNISYPRILENNRLFLEIPLSYAIHDKNLHPIQVIGGTMNGLSLFLTLYFGRS